MDGGGWTMCGVSETLMLQTKCKIELHTACNVVGEYCVAQTASLSRADPMLYTYQLPELSTHVCM